jgi:hypothetical protein
MTLDSEDALLTAHASNPGVIGRTKHMWRCQRIIRTD